MKSFGLFFLLLSPYNARSQVAPDFCFQSAKEYYFNGQDKQQKGDCVGAIQDLGIALDLFDQIKMDTITDRRQSLFILMLRENALLTKGVCKARLEDYRGAFLDFNKLIEESSYSQEAYYFKALSKLALDNIDSACLDL